MDVIKTNLQQLADCIEQHSDPEPFSGVVHMMRQNEVIFEGKKTSGDALVEARSKARDDLKRYVLKKQAEVFNLDFVHRIIRS